MKRRTTIAIGFATALSAAGIAVRIAGGPVPLVAQQQPCLHGPGETAEHQDRLRQAVLVARQLNSQEARAFSVSRSYAPLGSLNAAPTAPPGFKLTLTTNELTYTFSLKDTRDACRLALFSDQDGIIFEAKPMQ